MIPIFQMRNLRVREVNEHAEDDAGSTWHRRVSDWGPQDTTICLLNLYLIVPEKQVALTGRCEMVQAELKGWA